MPFAVVWLAVLAGMPPGELSASAVRAMTGQLGPDPRFDEPALFDGPDDPGPLDAGVEGLVELARDADQESDGTHQAVNLIHRTGRGAALLNDVEAFLASYVAYPSAAAKVAHTLWIAHTWLMDRWESTPRIAFLSPEPGSGKTRALEVTEPLVPRAVLAVNCTPAYLFRKVSDPAGPPTLLYDEIDTVFGPKAKDNEDVRAMLNSGHRRGATAGRCVVRGVKVETEELPAYCAVALAGIGNLPDTITARSIVVKMRRRARGEVIKPWRQRLTSEPATNLAVRLLEWVETIPAVIEDWPVMPLGVEDRNADIWEALLAVADFAGGDWPDRARAAAVTLVAESGDDRLTLGVTLLRDLQTVFAGRDRLPTETILNGLLAIEESPWSDLRGKPLDSRKLAVLLRRFEVKPGKHRDGESTFRGYLAADLKDPWSRYLPPLPGKTGTDGTSGTDQVNSPVSVPHDGRAPDRAPQDAGPCSTNVPGTVEPCGTAGETVTSTVPGDPPVPPSGGHGQASPAGQQSGASLAGQCVDCGNPLDRALIDAGETTHAACIPGSNQLANQ